MGKKRIPNINDFQAEETAKKKVHLGRKDEVKPSGKKKGRLVDMGELALQEMAEVEKKSSSPDSGKRESDIQKIPGQAGKTEEKAAKAVRKIRQRVRSRRYKKALSQVDRTKLYPVKDAVNLLLKLPRAKTDETVEVHLLTVSDKVAGEVKLPHGTGRTQKIVIFSEDVLKSLDKGKTDFDLLIARPTDMAKLAKYAKVLGPKGLFPNPKNGTISADPEKTVKEISGGKTRFKTESKAPLVHFVIGKISFGENKLTANLEALIKAVNPTQIVKIVLTSSQSPGIKLKVS